MLLVVSCIYLPLIPQYTLLDSRSPAHHLLQLFLSILSQLLIFSMDITMSLARLGHRSPSNLSI